MPKLTVCENPFNPSRDHRALLLLPGESVGAVLQRKGMDGEYVVSCNGEVLPPERGLQYTPQDGDDVQVVPLLRNTPLRTIAMIGVAALAAVPGVGLAVGAAAYSLFGAGFSLASIATMQAVGAAIVTIGGSLLVNGVASLFAKKPGGANYGVLGPQTVARSGIPIPKGFGTMASGGNNVESWNEIQGNNQDAHDVDDGADTIGRMYVMARFDYGFGPARSVSDIKIAGKDIADYADVAYLVLYGTNDQAVVTADDPRWVVLNRTTTGTTTNNAPTCAFDRINNNYPRSQRVRAGVSRNYVIIPGKRVDTERLEVFVTFPQGVWRYDDSMQIKRLGIDYDVYYRPSGSGDGGWILAQHHYYYNIRQTLLRQSTIIDGLTPGRYDVKVVKNGSGPPGNPLVYAEMENSHYGDELWVESVQETSYTALSYPNKIQILLRFMANDQLAGAELSVTAMIEYGLRSTLPALLADLEENNPAAVAYDIMSDGLIGAALPDSRIDLDFLREWADLTLTPVDDGDGGTQPLAVFNGVFDQDGMNIWDALGAVAVMSRANLQRVGTKVTGWLDKPDVPVMMFSVGNMINYSKTYLNLDDRAQEVEVDFADAADDYKTRNPVRIVLASDQGSSEVLKKTRVNLLGCTNQVQAYYWGTHKLLESETVIRTHTWETNTNAIRCRSGNVALLQFDVPGWPYGGNVQEGSTAGTLYLDRDDLPYDASSAYSVVVIHPTLKRASATVVSNTGGGLILSGYDGSPIQRVTQGDIDQAVSRYAENAVAPEDATVFAVGSVVDLWALDVNETRAVASVSIVPNGAIVKLAMPLSADPPADAPYIFQTADRQAKPVRIKQIKKRLGEQRYTIVAVDYSPDTYTIPAPSAGMSYVPPPSGSDGTGAAGNPTSGNTSQASISPIYVSDGSTYRVTGVAIQAAGSGYKSSSTAVLQSDYDDIEVVNNQLVETTDPTQTLQLVLSSTGAITDVTGFNSNTEWKGAPYIVLTR